MFESLCQSVHAKLLAGRCPWCGSAIINGQAIAPVSPLELGLKAAQLVKERVLEELARRFPDWGPKVAQPQIGNPEVTDEMLAIIEQCSRGSKRAIPFLHAALNDADWSVRMAAANALGRIGPDAKESLPTLFKLLEDADHLVRDAAAAAIKFIDQRKAR